MVLVACEHCEFRVGLFSCSALSTQGPGHGD
jgi:hypothetical protein